MSSAERVIIVTPPSPSLARSPLLKSRRARRLAAGYARVSTDLDEQQNSYEAQVDYYTRYIQENPDWEFVGVYTDEGISATSTKKRDGFNQMIEDALNGKIDLILTKSVSRFARNTVDSLVAVRQLKEKGVEVFFEKENIYTLDSKGELLITIMSSLAQEESRSISENVRMGKRMSYQKGKVSMPYKRFLGYEKGPDGEPRIVESEAKIVRLIYGLFMQGQTYGMIAEHLMEQKIPTPGGKAQWHISTVKSILKNEKYKGDALLQKTFVVDFLTKQQKANEGEFPQYYVKNSHPAIIDPTLFEVVQGEIARRLASGGQSASSPFSGKVICSDCGGYFGPKIWHSATKYRRTVFRCNQKYNGKGTCATTHLTEQALQEIFIHAANELLSDKDEILRDLGDMLPVLADTGSLEKEMASAAQERDVVHGLIQRCIDENAHVALDQEAYEKRYAELSSQHEALSSKIASLEAEINMRTTKQGAIRLFLSNLENRDGLLTEFDEPLWCSLVETMTIHADGKASVLFRSGLTIEVTF